MRFTRLESSSANSERAFSALKFIQRPLRTNYSITTMRDLARIRIKGNSDVMFDTEKDEYNDQSDDENRWRSSTRSQRTISSLAGSSSETSSQLWSSSFDYHSHASLSSEESRGRLIREFSDMFDFSLFNEETRSNSPALSCETLDENEVDRLIHEARRTRNAQSQAHEAQASTWPSKKCTAWSSKMYPMWSSKIYPAWSSKICPTLLLSTSRQENSEI